MFSAEGFRRFFAEDSELAQYADALFGKAADYEPGKVKDNPESGPGAGKGEGSDVPDGEGNTEKRAKTLQCEWEDGCKEPVTHVEAKGYVYCARHAAYSGRRARKLKPAEVKKLEAGEPIKYANEDAAHPFRERTQPRVAVDLWVAVSGDRLLGASDSQDGHDKAAWQNVARVKQAGSFDIVRLKGVPQKLAENLVDFGAGTLDFALIRGEERSRDRGHCTVLAKEGAPVGGNIIDAWIVEDICERYQYSYDRFSADHELQWWYRILLNEACRVKESLFFKKSETFYLLPSKLMTNYLRPLKGNRPGHRGPLDYSREDLVALLEKRGLYRMINALVDSLLAGAKSKGIQEKLIDEVLMVGGSTLLPNVYSVLEKRFGRDRVRAWQPFNAVAFGDRKSVV